MLQRRCCCSLFSCLSFFSTFFSILDLIYKHEKKIYCLLPKFDKASYPHHQITWHTELTNGPKQEKERKRWLSNGVGEKKKDRLINQCFDRIWHYFSLHLFFLLLFFCFIFHYWDVLYMKDVNHHHYYHYNFGDDLVW